MKEIRNIIFDLGGVIMNIDFKKTNEAFRVLGLENFGNHISQFHITDLFENYETGMIDDETFVKGVSALFEKEVNSEDVIAAWNAILLDFPPQRIKLLQRIKPMYRTFLLSNTNSLHHKEFQQRLYKIFGVYLEDLFEKTYYSHSVRLRKPGSEIFSLVLNENQLDPSETLFIDDTESNFSEAIKLGIQVYHLKPGQDITEMKMFSEKAG